MKIILDAMGGDNAPQAPVLGALQAAKDFGAQITLVGRGEEILKVLRDHGISTSAGAALSVGAPVGSGVGSGVGAGVSAGGGVS